jgi:thymidine phosphorylase
MIDEPARLPRARHEAVISAKGAGVVTTVDAGALGRAATRLGAGRARKEDRVDAGVGIWLRAKEGAPVERGAPLAVVRYNDRARFAAVRSFIEDSFTVGALRKRPRPLIIERMD